MDLKKSLAIETLVGVCSGAIIILSQMCMKSWPNIKNAIIFPRQVRSHIRIWCTIVWQECLQNMGLNIMDLRQRPLFCLKKPLYCLKQCIRILTEFGSVNLQILHKGKASFWPLIQVKFLIKLILLSRITLTIRYLSMDLSLIWEFTWWLPPSILYEYSYTMKV